MHRGESAPQAAFALHDHAKQEKPAHAQSAREKEIQSIPEAAYSASGNKVNYRRATQNSQASFRISTRESHHAASANRHRDRGDRLQKPGCAEKICHRKRQNSPAPCHRHACAFASQDHPRDQAQPLGLVDEIVGWEGAQLGILPEQCFTWQDADACTLEACAPDYAFLVRSPCSINFQNSRVSPSCASSETGSLLRKRKSRNVFLCKTRWTVTPSSVFSK
jgi:hypothetical protein